MPKKRPGNQHNNRHENGIVAPGKRITKQKSNGQLNGSADASPGANGAPTPSASAARATPQQLEKFVDKESTLTKDTWGTGTQDGSSEAEVAKGLDGLSGNLEHVNGTAHSSVKNSDTTTTQAVRKGNSLSLAYTIVRSCPLGDTITILIILLSIPSTVLTLVNTLFAMLTFMPPAASFFSIPNTFMDIFQSSTGTPSVATVIITDILGLLVWVAAWTPVQQLAIEYAQAVGAATLGGGQNAKKLGYDSTFVCMAVVTLRHVSSRGWIPSRILGFDWRAILSRIPYVPARASSFLSLSNDDFFTNDTKGGWEWFRILIALHKLIHGLVHGARRWYQKREYFHPASTTKKMDPEAGANTPVRRSSSTLGEAAQQNSTASAASTTTKTGSKETRDKTSTAKKKRKQAALVRGQQPLWAAFAATKVTILREYEQNHTMAEVNVPGAKNSSNLGNAFFGETENQIGISDVLSDSFIFHTTYAFNSNKSHGTEAAVDTDSAKPFHVRINGTNWTSTKISRSHEMEDTGEAWTGVVFGLTPSSSYRCSLVSSKGGVVLCSIIVTTSPLPSEENGEHFYTLYALES